MQVEFSAIGQALLESGELRYMISKTGEVLPKLVSVKTGRIFEVARVIAGNSNPVTVPFGIMLGVAQMFQTHRGFQKTYQMIETLQQTLQQSLEVLQTTTATILQCINQKAFDDRRRELERAYARFAEATKLVGLALECQNVNARDNYLADAVQTMSESLAIYNDPSLLPEMDAAGKLRRFECAWKIEQTIALVFQLQNEPIAASK